MTDYDLTDEDQIKQYLKNVETEYSYQCLSEKDPAGCHRLADFMDKIKGAEKVGGKLYKKNCDEYKYGHSCFKFAGKRMLGKGIEVNGPEGAQYFEKSCDYGYARGCSTAGIIYLEGRGIDPDVEKGLEYLTKACSKDRADSCSVVGTGYLVGNYGLEKDPTKAQALLTKGCNLGSLQACVNLSRMYKMGDGVPKNPAMAEKYKQAALQIKRLKDGDNKPGVTLGRT